MSMVTAMPSTIFLEQRQASIGSWNWWNKELQSSKRGSRAKLPYTVGSSIGASSWCEQKAEALPQRWTVWLPDQSSCFTTDFSQRELPNHSFFSQEENGEIYYGEE
jgi:hypothetical protein